MTELLAVLSLLMFSWMNLTPQSKTQLPARTANTTKTLTLTGTSFDEKNFVSDADQKIWTVTNRDMLRGHATQHVQIVAQMSPSREQLIVKSIKAMPAKHVAPANYDDVPLRP